MDKWRLITLDDGRQWLTDGTFGINPDGVPALWVSHKELLDDWLTYTDQELNEEQPDCLMILNNAESAVKDCGIVK